MVSDIWKLTKSGRKFAGSILPSRRNEVLDYLYDNKTGTVEDLVAVTGVSSGQIRGTLSSLRRKHYVDKVGG